MVLKGILHQITSFDSSQYQQDDTTNVVFLSSSFPPPSKSHLTESRSNDKLYLMGGEFGLSAGTAENNKFPIPRFLKAF